MANHAFNAIRHSHSLWDWKHYTHTKYTLSTCKGSPCSLHQSGLDSSGTSSGLVPHWLWLPNRITLTGKVEAQILWQRLGTSVAQSLLYVFKKGVILLSSVVSPAACQPGLTLLQQGIVGWRTMTIFTTLGHHNFSSAQEGLASLLSTDPGLGASFWHGNGKTDLIHWYGQGSFEGDCCGQWLISLMFLQLSWMAVSSLRDSLMALTICGSVGWIPSLFCHLFV